MWFIELATSRHRFRIISYAAQFSSLVFEINQSAHSLWNFCSWGMRSNADISVRKIKTIGGQWRGPHSLRGPMPIARFWGWQIRHEPEPIRLDQAMKHWYMFVINRGWRDYINMTWERPCHVRWSYPSVVNIPIYSPFSFIIYGLNYFPDIFLILLFKPCYLKATDIFLHFFHQKRVLSNNRNVGNMFWTHRTCSDILGNFLLRQVTVAVLPSVSATSDSVATYHI